MKDKNNTANEPQQGYRKVSPIVVISTLISFLFCSFIISTTIIERQTVINMKLEQIIFEKAHRISEAITHLLYKTNILSSLIVHDNGDSFDVIAPAIIDDPSIKNVFIAPGGIVTEVYPLSGNENVIGFNFFSGGEGTREAVLARELGDTVLGGPYSSGLGGQTLAGSMPVFIDTAEEEHKFWGLVSVTLNFNNILDHAELEVFETLGYSYELWRMNPVNNEKVVIASSAEPVKPNSRFVERPINIFHAEWNLKISPVRMWHNSPENLILIIAGICISFIVFFIMQNNIEMKRMQSVFEQMAITDPLTGIFNRRHFLEISHISIEKARRHKENCYFIMFDIDRFKQVNDTYGHQTGDKVLMDVTARIKADIRPYDLFARYGGEEFILFITGVSKKEVIDMVERLRFSLYSRKYEYDDDISIESSASFGIAQLSDYNIDKAIKHSDEALYTAKANGRNCVVFYEGNQISGATSGS